MPAAVQPVPPRSLCRDAHRATVPTVLTVLTVPLRCWCRCRNDDRCLCSQENILISDDVLKLADFGSCRGIYSKQPYTEYISTRWYRAPECLLTDGYYNYKMDIWGVGCVFFEIVSLFPLFPGTNELDQINKIHSVLGTPSQELLEKFRKHSAHIDFNFPSSEGTGIAKLIPHAPPDAVELMLKILAYNPDDRLSARQALRHAYFRELRHSDAEQKQKAKAQEHAESRGEKPAGGESEWNSAAGAKTGGGGGKAAQQQEIHAHGHEIDSQVTASSGKLVREANPTSNTSSQQPAAGSLLAAKPMLTSQLQ